jgi:hypothetical protein
MSESPLKFAKPILFWRSLFAVIFSSSLLIPNVGSQPAEAQIAQYCQLSLKATQEKETLRVSALRGNQETQKRYQKLIKQQAQELQDCRSRNWPQTQAIWLRLYPCDIQPGVIDQIMDRVVSRGYNEVYLEAFYDGQVLLPAAANPTVWPAVIRTPGAERVDLLDAAIKKGQERGLKVYAWMFTMNFGYTYGQISSRQDAIARNGKGQNSLSVVDNGSQLFIDPYNTQAKTDYYRMVQEIVRRRPDGLLFDYVRYPRQAGTDSIATKVSDLWLFTPATQEALFRRAKNAKGLELIRRFLGRGYITGGDVGELDKLYPQDGEPLWEGRNPPAEQKSLLPATDRQKILQLELWQLAVAHAMQGIIDFVALASYPGQQQRIPSGAVFFPDGNQTVGQGYDSRLQPWDRFPSSLQWHPMAYANCGNSNANCIVSQVQRVLNAAKPGTQVIPALAGKWGESTGNRPSLEAQMQALRQFAPQLKGVSHFAYSWQFPDNDSDRKFCRNP